MSSGPTSGRSTSTGRSSTTRSGRGVSAASTEGVPRGLPPGPDAPGDFRSPRGSLALRVLSGVVFVPLLVALARAGRGWFAGLILLFILLGLVEYLRLVRARGVRPSAPAAVLLGLAVGVLVWRFPTVGPVLGLTVALLVTGAVELLRREDSSPLLRIATAAFGIVYVAWLGAYLIALRELPRLTGDDYALGGRFVLFTFLATWGSDTAAYAVGHRFGRTPLLARVSPRKTLEGAAGGFAGAVLFALLGRAWFARFLSLPDAVLLGAIAGVLTPIGDLVESLLKRDAAAKDTARIIPGHGGVLDRFDGLLFTAPAFYYYLLFFVAGEAAR
jgi:phosphatidate cytidylyltransferase